MTGKGRVPRLALIACGLLGLLLLAYAVPAALLTGKVPPDTRVAGVDIGGLTPTAAESLLERRLGPAAARPIRVRVTGKNVALAPRDLGLTFDARATVAEALDGAMTPAGIVRSIFGARTLEPVVRADERRLNDRIAAFAKTVDRKPKEGSVRYKGLEPQAVLPKPGRAVDQVRTARSVRAAFMKTNDPVDALLRQLPASVPADEIRRIAASEARTAVARPFTVTNGSKKAQLSRADLAAQLRFVPDGSGSLRAAFDARGLAAGLEKQLVEAAQRPKDASFKITGGKPRVIPARTGQGIDTTALSKTISGALTGDDRSAVVPTKRIQPRVTTELAGKLGVKERVSSFTTNHPCCAPRVTNIHRIADIVDGYVVKPGETFSLNGVVGKRDKARGFVEAPMILNNRFVNDVGGGVSQFATTMFNAVFFGGFQDVQHRAHQYYISRYPAGRESTVSFPQPDFRWRNDSPYGVLIKTSYTSTSITVQFWSTKRYEIDSESSGRYNVKGFPTLTESDPECIAMEGAEGFTIDVWRIFKQDGKALRKQKFTTVYQPEPRLTCT
ncbi:VanW family protein [Nonomuraea basaltis]|uniref:VanW family protein n=1 Tax=Nonomuraea basaltis TaxID=2495887 RepID=UPI0014867A6F|nr:VanW family protein [Nonomuraea basaltis]